MDQMAAFPRALCPVFLPPGDPAWKLGLGASGQVRNLARINAARMKLAQDAGDLAEFSSAAEANLALARISSLQPTLIEALIGDSIETLTLVRLQALLTSHPAPGWLDAIDAAIARQQFRPDPSFRYEAERLAALDTIAWTFADPARVRWGIRSTYASGLVDNEFPGRLGTYAENREALNAFFRAAAKSAAQPRWLRPPVRPPTDLALAQLLRDSFEPRQNAVDQIEMRRRAYTVCSALERYFAAHRAYPASLHELTPSFLPQLPPDPWTGKPFGYRPRPPDADAEDPRGYILYSFGEDRQDNGGSDWAHTAFGAQRNHSALSSSGSGLDFVVNEWSPAQP
jgi:hypothetical protein